MWFNRNLAFDRRYIDFPDFIFDAGIPKVVEVSYGFAKKRVVALFGHWDQSLNWHEGNYTPEWFMIENIIEAINKNKVNND